ncbi:hypothetical protein L1D14_20520 [Vibrio tubiashii]|uniref:hypothetical protein n=1 Tax=Vibrio tubiashii TaxID=29498 RepID=UPI001EFCF52B|nr:hypothetical protein [Vibrio tubiashii]MCG9578606.1 hypothetical protein [Vibrio tubiashii]
MNEQDLPTSNLEHVLQTLLTRDIPAVYYLFERFAFLLAGIFFLSAIITILRVKSMTGNYSMSSMSMTEASPFQVASKLCASVFLGSFGLGQAVISNTVLYGNFEPYSIDVLRSISCSIDDMSGCVHYELGIFSNSSWQKAAINETFFEFFTGVLALFGTGCYLLGWINFSKLGNQGARTFFQCTLQIFIGALMMRPAELWQMFTGGF